MVIFHRRPACQKHSSCAASSGVQERAASPRPSALSAIRRQAAVCYTAFSRLLSVRNAFMHHGIGFIQDLAVVMALPGVVTVLFHRLKQPVVLGYIAAGVIIGPYTPPFPLIHDEQTIQTLGELGVVFLMFSLGLEFSLRKLFKVGATAIVAALSEIVLMLWIGYEIGSAFGWSPMGALFLGGILSVTSNTIIVNTC